MGLYSSLLKSIIVILGFLGSELKAQNTDAEVLAYNKTIEVDGNKLSQFVEVAIQVNNPEGQFMTEISLPFSASNKIKDITAVILDANGQEVKKLKKKDISEASSISGFSLYEDDFIKTFQLSHNRFPYTLKYSYSISYYGFLSIDQWTPALSTKVNTKLATLKVITPPDYRLSIHEQNISKGEKLNQDDKVTYYWQANYTAEDLKPEFYSPPISTLIPLVSVVPIQFEYGPSGSFESWSLYGEWLEKLSDGLQILPENEKRMVAELTSGLSDPQSKAKALYHYLQDNVRYINVAIGIGGMLPYPASYVAQNKYGDCKALTNYMKALLAEADIESFCVDVYADETPVAIIEDFPSQQFNHVILAVPTESDTLWLETTSNTNPFGYLGTFTQNRKALLVNQSNSQIINIPPLAQSQVTRNMRMNGQINSKNDIKAQMEITFRGDDFETILYYMKAGSMSDAQNYILARLPYRESTIIDIKQQSRDTPEIDVLVEIDLSEQGQVFGNAKVMKLPSFDIPRFERPENRQAPLLFPYPIHFIEELNYTVDPSVEAKIPTGVNELTSDFGHYSITTEQDGNSLLIKRELSIKSGTYKKDDYAKFYEFISSIENSISKTLITLK